MPIDDEERRALRRVIEAIGDRATPPAAFEELQLAADDQPARRPARVLVAGGVGALLLLALAAGFALSRNDDDTDQVAITQPEEGEGSTGPETAEPTPEEVSPSEDETSASTCAEDVAEARELLDPGITYDYTAFADLDELIEQSDLIVSGVATSVARTDANQDRPFTLIELDEVRILHSVGDAAPTPTVAFYSVWAGGRGDDPLADPVPLTGIVVVAFLAAHDPSPTGYSPFVQGVVLTCPADDAPLVSLMEPLPRDVARLSYSALVAAIEASSARVTERWAGTVDGPVVRVPEPGSSQGEALVQGTLELIDDCLVLGQYLVVWPAGTEWDPNREVVITRTGAEFGLGDVVLGGGGYASLSRTRQVVGPVGADQLVDCAGLTVGETPVLVDLDQIAILNGDAKNVGNRETGSGRPLDGAATIRSDLMVVHPTQVTPGATAELRFPQESERGIGYSLERRTADGWSHTHTLIASIEGRGEPQWARFDEEVGIESIGLIGPGPDVIVIPETALAGDYRICTANAGENFCAELTISE